MITANEVLCDKTNANEKKNTKGKKTVWTVEVEEFMISLWGEADSLFKTSSADYKRHDKRAAAREEIRRALQSQFETTFTGKQFFFDEGFFKLNQLWEISKILTGIAIPILILAT